MKKMLIVPIIALCCSMLSCNNESTGVSATTQKNLDAMHGVIKCFEAKDFSNLGDFIAEDAVDHAGEQGDIKGLANMKAEYEKMSAGFTNAKSEIIKELADDEYVMSWVRFTGTLTEDQMGMKAGDSYNMTAIEVAKMKDGKAIEHWSFMEPSEMMKMMGGMGDQMKMPADTTMKK